MTGDLVLTEKEVTPVMRAIFFSPDLQVTALHNHLLRSEPPTMRLRVAGRGDAVALAQRLRLAIEQSATPVDPVPQGQQQQQQQQALDLDAAAIDRVLGHQGRVSGGVYAVSVPRTEAVRQRGGSVPGALGSATAINFQPLGGGRAAVAGDLVLRGPEVDPVAHTLAHHRIEVTAIHNNVPDEKPQLFILHFWGVGDAEDLAQGLRAALDQTGSG